MLLYSTLKAKSEVAYLWISETSVSEATKIDGEDTVFATNYG